MDAGHNYANDSISFKTIFGASLSIIYIGVLLNYLVYKYDSMIKFTDTNILQSVEEHYFPDDYIVKGTKGSF